MSGYAALASVYDRLTGDVDYDRRAERLLALFARHRRRPDTLLDLACGTGSLALRFAAQGIEVIGTDGSADMLTVARERAAAAGRDILFLEQDMPKLDLYGTVEGAVCILDSLNHLTSTAALRETFLRLSLFVEPGGLLLFDVNTRYKHREILGDRRFVWEEEGLFCAWQNRFFPRTGEVEQTLDVFEEQPDGQYARYTDVVRERAYSDRTLRRLLAECEWEPVAVYDDLSESPPSAGTERELWVVRSITRRYAQ